MQSSETGSRELQSAINAFRAKTAGLIDHEDNAASRNRTVCLDALKFYRASIESALTALLAELPEGDEEASSLRANAAECLFSIAASFTWADEFIVAEELAGEALGLAQDTEAARNIQNELVRLRQFAEIERRNKSGRSADSTVELLRQRCATLYSTFAGKIVAKRGFLVQNRLVCSDELRYFRTQIEPAFNQAMQLLQPDARLLFDLRDEVAVCLANIATHHIWANEFKTAEGLVTESLRLSQGTWATVSIQKKHLQIRKSCNKFPIRKRDYRRVGMSASLVAVLLVFQMANRGDSPSIAAAPRPASNSFPRPIDPQLNQTAVRLKTLELQIQGGRDHAANLERQIRTLHDRIESLKEDRAAGVQIDSEALSAKLSSYNNLLRARGGVLSELNTDVHLHDQVVVERRLLLEELTQNAGNAK
jgi:hypothetical protein